MKKLLISMLIISLTFVQISAQEYSTTLSGENEYFLRLIDIDANLNIETNSGNKIEILVEGLPAPPEKAQGLRPLTKSGTDNTGLGLSMNIIDDIIELHGGKTAKNLKYHISIPENVNLYIASSGFEEQRKVNISNVSMEIEIFTSSRDLVLKDITGPVIARTDRGDIEIIFGKVYQDSPMSIISEDGDIDITLSESENATFKLSASEGEMYTDLEMKEMEEDEWSGFIGPNIAFNNNFVWSYNDFYKHLQKEYVPQPNVNVEIYSDSHRDRKRQKDDAILEDLLLGVPIEPGKYDNYDKAQHFYFDAQKWARPYFKYNFFYDSFFPYDYRGKLNRGGVEISARAQDGNIYLRKK